MKKVASILFVLIATLSLVFLTILPHHHHGTRECFMVDLSETANIPNNLAHHSSGESCVLSNKNYVVSETSNDEYLSKAALNYSSLLAIFLYSTHTLLNNEQLSSLKQYTEKALLYKSVLLSRSNALRAPPIA